jgi:hypothetical protein
MAPPRIAIGVQTVIDVQGEALDATGVYRRVQQGGRIAPAGEGHDQSARAPRTEDPRQFDGRVHQSA